VGTIFTLTTDIKTVARTVLDDMINELGKTIRLVYEPVKSECPNCLIDPVTRRSSGLYQAGGPIPFSEGQPCPVCEGAGWVVGAEKTEDIKGGVAWSPKDWYVPLPDIVLPAGVIQIKTFATNWGKVRRARHVIVQPEFAGVEVFRYKLSSALGDPSNLVAGRYCVGLFERI
jgi:hypothetical protein